MFGVCLIKVLFIYYFLFIDLKKKDNEIIYLF